MLSDWRSVDVDARQAAALVFLEQAAPVKGVLTAAHLTQLRAAGVSKAGIEELLYVCFSFNVLTRLADAFDFGTIQPQQMAEDAKMMLRFGYGATSL